LFVCLAFVQLSPKFTDYNEKPSPPLPLVTLSYDSSGCLLLCDVSDKNEEEPPMGKCKLKRGEGKERKKGRQDNVKREMDL
jgi:hypothetical protein